MIRWSNIMWFFIIFMSGELLAILIFWLLSKVFKRNELSLRGVVRGVLERFFIYFSMANEIFHALTLFGALKIATHIKDDDRVGNDYFLIGNLISVFMAIAYYLLFKHLTI